MSPIRALTLLKSFERENIQFFFAIGQSTRLAREAGFSSENSIFLRTAWSMAPPVALGYALSKPTALPICIEGDGGFFHNCSYLVTMKSLQIRNLHAIFLSNGTYHATGGQQISPCGRPPRIENVVRAFGHSDVASVATSSALEKRLKTVLSNRRGLKGTSFTVIEVRQELSLD